MTPVAPMFSRLESLIAERDFEAALTVGRELWNQTHDPALVDVMEAVARHLPRTPIARQGGESHDRAWVRRAEADAPGDVDVLLDDLLERPSSGCGTLELESLLQRTPDPRVARRIATFLEGRPRLTSSNRSFWLRGIDLVVQTEDPPTLARVQTWFERHRGRTKPWGMRVAAHLEQVAETLDVPEPPSPDPALIALLARIPEPSGPAEDLVGLWSAAYDAPADLGIRHVLADRLQDAGEARGEFIALQLERGAQGVPSRREKALLKQWEREWLGPIAPVVLREGTRWENGFLVEARYGNEPAKDGVRSAREWATVEALDVAPQIWVTSAFDLLDNAELTALQTVWGVAVYQLDHLGERTWHTLGIRGYEGYQNQLLERIQVLDGLPALRTLSVARMEGIRAHFLDDLLLRPRIQRLETLVVPTHLAEGLAQRAAASDVAFGLRTVPWDLRLQRGDNGVTLSVRSRGHRRGRPNETLIQLALANEAIDALVVEDAGPVKLDVEVLAQVVADLDATLELR